MAGLSKDSPPPVLPGVAQHIALCCLDGLQPEGLPGHALGWVRLQDETSCLLLSQRLQSFAQVGKKLRRPGQEVFPFPIF